MPNTSFCMAYTYSNFAVIYLYNPLSFLHIIMILVQIIVYNLDFLSVSIQII